MTPTELFFDIPKSDAAPAHRTVCYEWGNKSAAQTIICVHGLTRNGRDFDFLASRLAENFRILCPDMPGRGKSEWLSTPAAYNYATYLADIKFISDTLALHNAHWIGTSMGGILGMMMATLRPGFLQSLVLNDVGVVIPVSGLERIAAYAGKNTLYATKNEAEAALRRNCATFGIQSEAEWQQLFTYSLQDAGNGRVRLAYDPAIAESLKNTPTGDVDLWPWWEPLTKIPLLLIRGENSDILPQSIAQTMQKKHPRLTLHEIPGAGHAPALMAASDISYIQDWLKTAQ